MDKERKKEMPEYRQIRAVYTEDTIRVYQAYSPVIAGEAVEKGTFGEHFSMNRMTWIKPSFLWMMYRCGWAEKQGQERVLAIDIKRSAFDWIVRHGVASSWHEDSGMTKEEWQEKVASSDVRCQWDPERDIWGNPLAYRSIQLGLRREAVRRYVNDWIVHITDITDYVADLQEKKKAGISILELLPQEKVYHVSETRCPSIADSEKP